MSIPQHSWSAIRRQNDKVGSFSDNRSARIDEELLANVVPSIKSHSHIRCALLRCALLCVARVAALCVAAREIVTPSISVVAFTLRTAQQRAAYV